MRRSRKRLKKSSIRRRALRIEQNDKHPLYVFCLTGDEILEVADISRLSRDDAGKLIGYQRADVKRHIQDIVAYLNSDDILFPNSLILALSSKVKFHVSRGPLAVPPDYFPSVDTPGEQTERGCRRHFNYQDAAGKFVESIRLPFSIPQHCHR